MLEIFRRNLFINSLLLFPYFLLIRISLFFTPVASNFDSTNSFLFGGVEALSISPFVNWIATSFLIFFQALLINRMAIRNGYDKNLSLFSGLFYGLFVSMFQEYMSLSPALIANTFIILSLMESNKLYKILKPAKYIFNVGFFAGLAFVIYFPSIIILPVLIIGLFSLRAQNLKEFLQLVVAFLVLLFIVWSYGLVQWDSINFKGYFSSKINAPDFSNHLTGIFIGAISVISICLAVFRRSIFLKKSIQATKKMVFLYWLLVFSSLLLILGTNQLPYYKLLIPCVPIGVLFGLYISNQKSRLLPELFHLLLLAILFTTQFDLLEYLK